MKIKLILFCILLSGINFGQVKDKNDLQNVTKEMLQIIKKHSVVSDSINWTEFNLEIQNEVNNIEDVSSADFIINKILRTLKKYGDNHSFYSDKSRNEKLLSKKDSIQLPSSKLIGKNVGYLRLPHHSSMNKNENYRYADTLRKQIQHLDQNYLIKGWIVDLRGNTGGNMWPMLAGLNPLIEDGIVGYFVTGKKRSSWRSDSMKPQQLMQMNNTYKVKKLDNKIALLLYKQTASSGEMTAISLLGRKNSKSFGEQSAGYTTANGNYDLSNGASLFLANSYCENRNKKVYVGSIQPDVEVDNSDIIETTLKWIEK